MSISGRASYAGLLLTMLWLISATRGPSAAESSIAFTQTSNMFPAVVPSNFSTTALVNVALSVDTSTPAPPTLRSVLLDHSRRHREVHRVDRERGGVRRDQADEVGRIRAVFGHAQRLAGGLDIDQAFAGGREHVDGDAVDADVVEVPGRLLERPCVITPERPCSLLTIGSVTSPRTWMVSLPRPPITVVTMSGLVPRM